MPSGAKKRKAAKKKNHKGGGGGGPINHNNTTNYPSSSSTYSQGEDDSKSQDDRESDAGSPLSQEKNDHEHHHPFDEENVASERTDTPSVASDLTGSQLGNAEDPAGGDILIKDDERLVEVNSLNMGAVNASPTNERKQEEDPSYALSSEASSVIEEKALHSSAGVESHVPEVEKAVVEDDNGSLRVESDPTENAGFEQVMPPVEVEQSLKSSASDDNEEKGIEDACIEEKDVNPSFVEGCTQILIAERSADDTNDDVEVNPASKVDWDTPVVPMSDMANSVIDNVQSAEVLEVVECRLGDNEDKELQETSDVNGTLPSVNGKEGKVFPSEEDHLEGKTLTSAKEVFPLADENGSKTSLGEVDSVMENEDKVLIVTKEKEGGSVPVADDMIGSSAVAASAAEIAKEAKTKTPGAGSVDNVSTVEASDVAVKGNEDTLLKLTDSDTEKAGIDKTKKDISVSARTQLPVARASGLWALVMSCFGISKRYVARGGQPVRGEPEQVILGERQDSTVSEYIY